MSLLEGIGDFFTGGAVTRNKNARRQAKSENAYNKAVYEFQYGDYGSDDLGGEALRQYEYAVEGRDILARNTEANLKFQEANLVQQYDYQMGIREYEFNQAKRAYDESVSRAMRQQSFNDLAEQAALVDQNRLYHEQLIGLALDETETLFNYGAAAAGIGLKKRQAKAAAVTTTQEAKVSAIKAAGASLASGAFGRSAAANIQGIVAESGAKQAAIVDSFLFNTEATDQDMMRLNGEFLMDQVGFEFSRDSAKLSNMATQSKIKAQALQAALAAHESIQLKPEIGPALPKPFALPRPEFQPVYKQDKPPQPMKAQANTENLFGAFATETVNKVAMAASLGAFGGGAAPGFNASTTQLGAGGGSVGGVGTFGPNFGFPSP